MRLDYKDYSDHYMRVSRAKEMVTYAFLGGVVVGVLIWAGYGFLMT